MNNEERQGFDVLCRRAVSGTVRKKLQRRYISESTTLGMSIELSKSLASPELCAEKTTSSPLWICVYYTW